jgi:Protein of unknown function (DUF3025)
MKIIHEWNPAALLHSPLFTPLHPVLARLDTAQFPSMRDFNTLLAGCQPPLSVQPGHSLRFVPQESGRLGFEAQYEPRCYLSGEVQTRPDNWHDMFNALVWLTFPKAKAAINTRHYLALTNEADSGGSQRGRVRDMATLLDESGVLVVCANAELAELLRTFQWKKLFWQHREQVRTEMGFHIFGHGLYEKALQPYVGMTGQGLILHVPADFFSRTLAAQLNYLDERTAEYLNNPGHCISPRELHPVPLLGVPGWDRENSNAAYYDNTSYFRAGRREAKQP